MDVSLCYLTEDNVKKIAYPDIVNTPSTNYITFLTESLDELYNPWEIHFTKNLDK